MDFGNKSAGLNGSIRPFLGFSSQFGRLDKPKVIHHSSRKKQIKLCCFYQHTIGLVVK